MRNGFVTSFAALAIVCFGAGTARAAEPLRLHLSAAAAHAFTGHQSREFGWGGAALPAVELPLTRALGLQLELGALWLSEGKAPSNPNIQPEGSALSWSATLGLRLRPFATSHDGTRLSPSGFWLAAGPGAAYTGALARPMVNVQLGFDFLDQRGRAGMGPMVGFYHVFQPDGAIRPDDANVLLAGVHALFDFGPGIRLATDRDHDGIYDEKDACPDQPEDRDAFEDDDGCPDLDDDKDGIEDTKDRCPRDPEDKDGFEDDDGCPELDNDRDGIPDNKDKCPNEAEDKDDYEDEDGCPDPDNDKDGIPDVKDLCPFEAETVNDYADDDGCPDEDQVRVVGDKIVLDDRVHFMINSHIIRRDSFALLGRLAKLISEHPEYIHIAIEGHADERGAEDFNQRLSQTRAAAVMEFLVKAGVKKARLSSAGFGSSRPLVDRKGEFAYYQNRRVEFIITREGRLSSKQAMPPKPESLGTDGPPPPDMESPSVTPPAPPLPTSKPPVLAPPTGSTPPSESPAPKADPKGEKP